MEQYKRGAGAVCQAGFWHAEVGDEGLYGCVQVKNSKIVVDANTPWTKDCLEVWLETDLSRDTQMGDQAFEIVFAPNPSAGAGKCIVTNPQGSFSTAALKAMWKPCDGGYQIEFFLPVNALKVQLAEGLRLGFNYSVDEGGKAIEEFFSDKDIDDGYKTPNTWGVIELGK